MSDFPTNSGNTLVYCSVSDVARMLQISSFTTSSKPTYAQVESFILEAQEIVDQATNHAWRERVVTEEFLDFDDIPIYDRGAGIRVPLKHRTIRSLSSGSGDTLEVWNGNSYENYLSSKTQGRDDDYWLDYRQGVLFLKRTSPHIKTKKINITYRYGESQVPKDIQKATALIVAKTLLVNEDRSSRMVEGEGGQMVYDSRYQKFQDEIDRILTHRTEFIVL